MPLNGTTSLPVCHSLTQRTPRIHKMANVHVSTTSGDSMTWMTENPQICLQMFPNQSPVEKEGLEIVIEVLNLY